MATLTRPRTILPVRPPSRPMTGSMPTMPVPSQQIGNTAQMASDLQPISRTSLLSNMATGIGAALGATAGGIPMMGTLAQNVGENLLPMGAEPGGQGQPPNPFAAIDAQISAWQDAQAQIHALGQPGSTQSRSGATTPMTPQQRWEQGRQDYVQRRAEQGKWPGIYGVARPSERNMPTSDLSMNPASVQFPGSDVGSGKPISFVGPTSADFQQPNSQTPSAQPIQPNEPQSFGPSNPAWNGLNLPANATRAITIPEKYSPGGGSGNVGYMTGGFVY